MKRVACIFALSLCFVSSVLAAPPLPAYGIDIHQTSVSGVSSGAAMAVQMHVAHSSIMYGVGVIAGVAYDCADSSLPFVLQRLGLGASCMDGSVDYASASIARTDAAAINSNAIDATANLGRQKVWLFSGYNDGLVRRGAMNAVAEYYQHYSPGNVFYKTNNHAPHALITDDYGITCLDFGAPYINNCNYDAAGFLLKHIYGHLNPPSSTLSSSPQAFDQREFVGGNKPKSIGLADTGYLYVPMACKTETCRVHVVFHGCKQYAGNPEVGDAVYNHGGYNKWADTNKIVVLYPQTVSVTAPFNNLDGCWDWFGYISDQDRDFAQKNGHQISAIKKMLDRLAEGFASGGGSSDTFQPPQNFSVADSSSTYLALIWQPNSAATGFNIYRSFASGGPYTKIGTVSGASFADKDLTPNTTYYYKISAINGSNESALTGPVPGTTASDPPACDPYSSDNKTHVAALRAYTDGKKTWAVGSNDRMGKYSDKRFKQLIKEGLLPPSYRVRYCS